MLYGLWGSARNDPDFPGLVNELLQSTSRSLVLITGGAFLAWYVWYTVVALRWLDDMVLADPIALAAMLICAAVLWLIARQRFLAAQALWQIGVAGTTVLAIYILRQPEIAFLYALLPLTAVVTVGWPAGVLSEGLVIAVVWQLSRASLMPTLSASYSQAIIIGGAFTSLVGWAATRTLLVVSRQALSYSRQAFDSADKARQHRMELAQIREDLLHANRELGRLSDRLEAMYRIAEEARQAKEEFVANVSHELRTPLNMIISFSEMITQSPEVYGDKLPPTLLADVSAIQRNSRHLAKLVDDVLDLSQIDAGRMALSKQWTSITEVIEDAVTSMRALFEARGIFLETEIEPGLPMLFCDGTRIKEVLINLLSNAGRFTERGGVQVKASQEEGNIVVSVADTGPGISPADQDRIFEPFQQLDASMRRRHGGTGLGLGISKRLVEMHGGKMWLKSEVDVGTTLYFSLPVSTLAPTALTDDDAARWIIPSWEYHVRTRSSKAPPPEPTCRYVLLEKGDTLQRLFHRYMDAAEVCTVQEIEGAVHELHRSPAQALVVNMPTLVETTTSISRLADLPYGTPTVSCWLPGEGEAAEQLGVVRYLVKPISQETLLSTLENLGKNTRSVLVVDDSLEVLQLFARMLTSGKQPYDVLQATSGEQALDLLRERQPDVMLLDLIMPEVDGFHVLEEKRRDPSIREIPTIIISARDPTGEVILSDGLVVTRRGGLSAPELLTCIQALSQILAPSSRTRGRAQSGDQGQPEKPAA